MAPHKKLIPDGSKLVTYTREDLTPGKTVYFVYHYPWYVPLEPREIKGLIHKAGTNAVFLGVLESDPIHVFSEFHLMKKVYDAIFPIKGMEFYEPPTLESKVMDSAEKK